MTLKDLLIKDLEVYSLYSLFFFSVSLPPDAQPTEAERETWEEVDVVLKDALGILDELQAYKGAGQEIREVHVRSVMLDSYYVCTCIELFMQNCLLM